MLSVINIVLTLSFLTKIDVESRTVNPHRSYPKWRIINGQSVGGTHAINWNPTDEYISGSSTEFPYMVSIEHFGINFCGGAIIRKDIVITAAHCVQSNEPRNLADLTVHAGRLASEGPLAPMSQRRKIETAIVHEKYQNILADIWNLRYDLALIKVIDPFDFNEYVNLIKLPNPSESLDYSDSIGISLGWGNTMDGIPSKVLLKMKSTILTETLCSQYSTKYDNRLICALGQNKSNVCVSDSGGPLVIHNDGQPDEDILIAVHSFTKVTTMEYVFQVCSGDDPYYSTNVAYFRDWIEMKLKTILI